ncbi:XRE family transcriptional regulator [Capnocytophaga sputigena]|uniref:XRE family transcriptional regulator n=1 Tax=Capnocytophaga sputigena TaxID=1019 RepID=UPI0028E7B37D|nr:XRE family transcriptional regulator [Capnocytophaga sputigena]
MIKNEMQYNAIMKRIGELLQIVDDNTHESNPDYIELMILTDLVEAYEDMYYPIENTLSSQSLTLSPNSESLKTPKVIV